MPWRSVSPMEEKIRFIGDYLNGVFSFIELWKGTFPFTLKFCIRWIE